jgi:hypothetical protein
MIPTVSCEDEEPFECPEGPTRTLSVQWTAAGALETSVSRFKSKGPCRTQSETREEFQVANASGTLDGVSLGSAVLDPERTYVRHNVIRDTKFP